MNDFGVGSKDLSDFFTAISVGKQKRKKELDETVGSAVDDFFSTISTGKKVIKEKKETLVGNSFDELFLSALTEEITPKKKKKVQEQKTVKAFEDWLYSETPKKQEQVIEEVIENSLEEVLEVLEEHKEELEEPKEELIEKSLGLLAEPSDVKQQNDPLTPLDQKFATLDDLQKHYKLFLSRIQQQLSTLGGGGETRLEFLDDVNRNSVKSDHKFLRYDAPSQKWIGAYAGEAPFISSTTYVTSASYTITENDYYIGVNYAGAVTITLPTTVIQGTTYIVKDELGEASKGTNRYITILPSGSDKIDGQDRAILAYNFGSLTFVYRNGWRVV